MRARAAVAVLGLWLAAPASAQAPAAVELDYRLYVGGLHALSLTARIAREGEGYRMRVLARTDGLVAELVDAAYEAESAGVTDGAVPRPRRYRGVSRDGDENKSVALSWSPERVPAAVFEPAHDAPTEPLADEVIAGTVDPASAALTLMTTLAASGRCELRVPVFDGKRRYDLVAGDGGSRELRSSRYAPYAGPATECVVAIERIAGFRSGKLAGRYPDRISIFLAPLWEGMPVPVRLHASNLFGALRIHLVARRGLESFDEGAG
jgi:hypothetical protein